jgi:hypothetical protein
MIPLYRRERANALLMTISSFLLLLLPFIALPVLLLFSATTLFFTDGNYPISVNDFLLLVDITTIGLLFSTSVIQSKYTLFQNILYSFGSSVAGVIIFFAFTSSILVATKKKAVSWKDRQYIINKSI